MKFFSHSPMFALLATLITASSAVAQFNGKELLTPAESAIPQATDITSTTMELWGTDKETQGLFTGNVVVTATNMRMTCDRLEIIASRIGDKTVTIGKLDKFKYLLATGRVHMIQGDREANCGRAEVYPREERIVLTEKPVVIDHGSEATYVGDELDIYRGDRRVKGRNVNITFPAIRDLGFDKKQSAPQPPTPTPLPPGSGAAVDPAVHSGIKLSKPLSPSPTK